MFVPGKDGNLCNGGFRGNLDDALIVGWAMVTRGELGFVMAQDSFNAGIMRQKPYVSVLIFGAPRCLICLERTPHRHAREAYSLPQ